MAKQNSIQSCNSKGGQKCGHSHRNIDNASVCAWRREGRNVAEFSEGFLATVSPEGKQIGKIQARLGIMEALAARSKRLGELSTDPRFGKMKIAADKAAAADAAKAAKKAPAKKAPAKKAPAKKAASAKPAAAKKTKAA